MVKTPVDSGASSEAKQEDAASEADPTAPSVPVRVTHDFLMECVLCGKGTDEQHVHTTGENGSASEAVATRPAVTHAAAAAPAPLPSFSLSSIQLRADAVADPTSNKAEEGEWE